MRDLVMLDWMVPKRSWTIFRQNIESKYGSVEGYLGRKAVDSMDEFAEADGYTTVEDHIDRLVRAAGRRPKDRGKQKNADEDDRTDLTKIETTRVTIRVDRRVKERFKKYVDQSERFDSYGVAFGRALELYCDGGRAARIEDKLDRIVDDAEAVLSELQDDEGGDEGLGAVERRTITICHRLDEQFTDDVLVSEIADVAGSSKPTIEKYRQRVIKRLNVEPHPNASKTVWVPEEYAAELAPEGTPRVCRQPVELLDREERLRRLHLVVGRRAAKRSSGRVRVKTPDVRGNTFDNEVSRSSVLDLMEAAALTKGFDVDRNSTSASIRVNLEAVGDSEPDLFQEIIEYRDGEADDLLSDTTEATVSDFSNGPSPTDVGDRLDTLSGAATDGGGPPRDQDNATD